MSMPKRKIGHSHLRFFFCVFYIAYVHLWFSLRFRTISFYLRNTHRSIPKNMHQWIPIISTSISKAHFLFALSFSFQPYECIIIIDKMMRSRFFANDWKDYANLIHCLTAILFSWWNDWNSRWCGKTEWKWRYSN